MILTPNIHSKSIISKHSRLIKRNIASFEITDTRIKDRLESLESLDNNLWTAPDYNKNQFVHSIFQYPAMMVPEVQRSIIDVIFRNSSSNDIKSMLDPFMGSATSLVSSMHYGLDCYGQDINPLAILISKVRTSIVNINFIVLKKSIKNLIKNFSNDVSNEILIDFEGRDKWFKDSVSIELSRIVKSIKFEKNLHIRRFFWANLAEVIRICSNDRTSTFKLHSRPLDEIQERKTSPLEEMTKQLAESLAGYTEFKAFLRKKGRLSNSGYKGQININLADSSKEIHFGDKKAAFAELLISSPPYGDNHTTVTYGQYSFLQLQWIDLKDIDESIDITCLKSTQEIDNRSLGGRKRDASIKGKADFIATLSQTFKEDLKIFNCLDIVRFSKIVIFLDDLIKVVDNSLIALKTNSYMIWTMGDRNVGNLQVQNIKYLKEILESKKCVFVHSVTRDILHKRMAKKNNNTPLMNTEEILVLRKTC